MKVKRLLMVQHSDGKREYICKSCGQPMRHCDDYRMDFRAGEIDESGGEYLQCKCGHRTQYPKLPDHYCTLDA